ncbi:hypothetical protein PAXRUDRAFT_640490 [Paxillus rubicundulus Ve08.2h10]|uniref:Uncharacterized protein n=1 Tax=Paxillus rubicundulus Ve08.2h10 TaxID=930991 RepID=A0A0D0DJF1_9AGAM|nr:hypothetical protein PAXRUDRAFT_640490 [Paxillus rubicundulus Ve08.2h10]
MIYSVSSLQVQVAHSAQSKRKLYLHTDVAVIHASTVQSASITKDTWPVLQAEKINMRILRRVQQERDHYRSEMARFRTENASLLNEIDVLKARLSDREGERVVQEAVDAQRKACTDYIKNKVGVEDAACINSPPVSEILHFMGYVDVA